jgi:hypothetical protein
MDPVLLERRLSSDRLGPYKLAAAHDFERAVALYTWNAQLNTALAETIGHLEVLVRNVLHEHLTAWSTATFNESVWYRDPGRLLAARMHQDIREARSRATRDGRVETPGKVVSELSFGFWRFLLAAAYHRTLWTPCLTRAFPGRARADVQARLALVNLARNRCAHHEPMHNRPVDQIHADAIELASWLCVPMSGWIAARTRVPDVLTRRP